ncbi:carbonic anhydrase [Lepidopterella palustris CBS 459.81]|uniref:Carbonic anhydrase n=1 Tax=Lepidopterella palustris CBS 459.81 TaxID=1314670 RepID=A0A8E2JKF7_9PEZI|nr:carbonic anhydrase [Lepidopterella palustris CBS 459.81]
MTSVADLVQRNKELAASHTPIPTFAEMAGLGMGPPKTAILTCVDGRCSPENFVGLKPRDALVIRNICGHLAPALADIAGLDAFIGFNEIMVVHHTDCGATHFTNEMLRDTLKKRLPEHEANVDAMTFGAITDIEQSVKDDVDLFKKSPLIRKELAEHTYGFVYDIKTGLLTPVEQ